MFIYLKKISYFFLILFSSIILAGCYPTTLEEQSRDIKAAQEASDNISIGKVQREIKIGMSNADVVAALGSPNMVTTDDQRREAWVYDRVSTEVWFKWFAFFLVT
jgi:outer membrane protein assembly factor BamE (lipoprotein component of BamABCDE complex)